MRVIITQEWYFKLPFFGQKRGKLPRGITLINTSGRVGFVRLKISWAILNLKRIWVTLLDERPWVY